MSGTLHRFRTSPLGHLPSKHLIPSTQIPPWTYPSRTLPDIFPHYKNVSLYGGPPPTLGRCPVPEVPHSFIFLQEADIAACTFILTPQRFQVVDYLTPFLFDKNTFMVKLHPPEHNIFSFLKPLHSTTWGVLFAAAIVVFCITNGVANMVQEIMKGVETKKSVLGHLERVFRILCQYDRQTAVPGIPPRTASTHLQFSRTLPLLQIGFHGSVRKAMKRSGGPQTDF